MTYCSGAETKCGMGLESLAGAYGTLVEPTILLPYVSSNIDQVTKWLENNILNGSLGRTSPELVGLRTTGSLRVRASYRTTEFLLYALLGGAATKSGASSPYTHTINIGSTDRAMSVYIDKIVTMFEIAGALINAGVLTIEPDGCYWDFDFIAKITTHGVTYRTALDALSLSESNPMLFIHQAEFRIADCDDALQASDEIAFSGLTFRINNNRNPDIQTSVSQLYVAKPVRNNFRDVELTFTLPLYESDTLFEWKDNGTKLQVDLVLTGGDCGSGNYTMIINIPTLYIRECKGDVSGPEITPITVTATCHRNDDNDNMAETEEAEIILLNGNDTVLSWLA